MLYFTSKWCYKLVIDARNEAVEEQYKVTGLVKGEFYGAHPLHVRYTVECFNEETGEKETFRIDEAHYEDLKDAMDQMAIEETEIDNITISVKYLPGTKALMELNRME